MCDGNQVNKSYFKHFETISGKPWLSKRKNSFPFDYVHLSAYLIIIKCIRSNWLTEKYSIIANRDDNGDQQLDTWSDLTSLLKIEESYMLKLSKLDFVAVHPKPIEHQNVKTCLCILCDKTITALQTHTGLIQQEQ